MALKPMNPGAVSTATVVSDLPDMPQDLADRTAVAKWWFDTRLVFQRLLSDIERRRNVGGTEPATEYSPTWDSITGKPDKFPPEDHSHAAGKATPLVQVVAEDPLVAGTTDPDTGNAEIGFHEQTAATFLAGPVIGPPQLPVFRPILLSDLPASVRDMPTGGNPGTLDDLNGGTGGYTPQGALVRQARGGECAIIGHAPLDGVETTPWTRWLLKTMSGSATDTGWLGDSACGGTPTYVNGRELLGSAEYAADTGVLTNTMVERTTVDGGTPSDRGLNPASALPDPLAYGTRTTTATADVYVHDGECHELSQNSGRVVGTLRCDLSVPDTEDNAYTRAWGATEWGAANTALRTDRGAALAFIRRKFSYRIEYTTGTGETAVVHAGYAGLKPWWTYTLVVGLRRRPVHPTSGEPTGDWESAGTVEYPFQAALDGTANPLPDWVEVDAPVGYELDLDPATTLLRAS